MKTTTKLARNLTKLSLLAAVLIALVGSVSAQTVTMKRYFIYPGIYKDTKLGEALLANGVNSDVAADIAFSALGDSLNMAADSVSGGAVGRLNQAATITAGKNIDPISDTVEFLRNKKVQLPRMSKFRRTDAVYLQYDSGKWCIIPNGPSLSVIRADALDPMIRTDIPANAGSELCRMPDGFYLGSDGRTVFMTFSSKNTDESWYGIGFGDSYCGIPNEAQWQELVKGAFTRLWAFDPYNVRQPTLIRMASDATANLSRGRTYTGLCAQSNTNDAGVSIAKSGTYRNIMFPDHFKTSGHGAALVVTAKGSSVLGDVLTSNEAEFISGATGIPFYGTGAKLVAALSAPDTTLPRMVKRSNNDTVYLQYDDGSYCAMSNPTLLSVMRGGVLEVARNDSLPGDVKPESAKICGFPDGFFKAPDVLGQNVDKQVYYLFSSAQSNSSWYGMGFGDSYCKIPSEDVWRKLISYAGGDGGAPQESLIRVPTDNLFKGRTEKPCPNNVVNGVVK